MGSSSECRAPAQYVYQREDLPFKTRSVHTGLVYVKSTQARTINLPCEEPAKTVDCGVQRA